MSLSCSKGIQVIHSEAYYHEVKSFLEEQRKNAKRELTKQAFWSSRPSMNRNLSSGFLAQA